jgi:excinuclease UvrABC ATPase subunit
MKASSMAKHTAEGHGKYVSKMEDSAKKQIEKAVEAKLDQIKKVSASVAADKSPHEITW